MSRNFKDWVKAYVDYASFSEAPTRMHFWTGVSTIAGALRRRVWLDMEYFKWTPNFYIVLVAPPGIVSKSTTAAIGMNLLRKVPGIKFGPDVVTWPALVTAFSEATESFDIGGGEFHTQSAMTLESSEFGNLVNPQDREMIDLLVSLWDSKQGGFKKITKGSGNDSVENPWINMIACTTPAWIAGNFPEYVIGGGFTSRCIFVYAEEKSKLVAYPHLVVPPGMKELQKALIADLEHISVHLVGTYNLTPEAIKWGELWYAEHYSAKPENLTDDRFGGYLARKQTHIHKLAIVIAASRRDELIITAEDLMHACGFVTDLEQYLPEVFARIGRSEDALKVDKIFHQVKLAGKMPYETFNGLCMSHFPDANQVANITKQAIAAGMVRMDVIDMKPTLTWIKGDAK